MNETMKNAGEGMLPSPAPLANPYVPFQMEDPPKYTAEKGLIRGTLFPGLDLPFMGMVNTKEKKLTPTTQLQILAFVLQELALYLDTHRDDMEALELYRKYQMLYHEKTSHHSMNIRQMNHRTPSKGNYGWLDDPWPWEYCANKEG